MTAQIKVGNSLVKPKAIHVFQNGEWQNERNAYVYHNGVWVSLIEYRKWIYEAGLEHVELDERRAFSSMERNDNHLILDIKGMRNGMTGYYDGGYIAVASNTTINVDDYDSIFFEVEDGFSRNEADLGLGENTDRSKFTAKTSTPSTPERSILEINIGDLQGDYYVKMYGDCRSPNEEFKLRINNIWLE